MVQSQPSNVEEGFVNRERLDRRRERLEDLEDRFGKTAILVVVRGHYDRMGAQPTSMGHRHGTAGTSTTRLIGRGRHHTARAGAADEHGTTDEFGPTEALDLDEERIHVHMGDPLGEHRRRVGTPRCPKTRACPGSLHSTAVLDRLFLVRHGEVLNPNHVVYADLPGYGLSSRGHRQAAETAEHLRSSGASVLVASPLQRAVETATPISLALGVPLMLDERLVEWRLSNRWAGVTWEDVDDTFPGELSAYLSHPHDLAFSPESIAEAAQRVIDVVRDLGDQHPGATAIVVGHQDPTQGARLSLTGRSLADLHRDKPDHGTAIELIASRPWREVGRWDPLSTATPFPPIDAKGDDDA